MLGAALEGSDGIEADAMPTPQGEAPPREVWDSGALTWVPHA